MARRTPAFIREVVERSKLELLHSSVEASDENLQLTAKDLELAFHNHSKEREGVEAAMRDGDMIRAALEKLMNK